MRRRKVILLTLSIITISMLAVAGKLIVDGRADKLNADGTELPSAREEYQKLIRKLMFEDTTVKFSGAIRVSDGDNPQVIKEESSFSYMRSGHSFYSSLAYQQTLFNGRYLLQIDSLHKMAFITVIGENADHADQLYDPGSLTERLFSDTAKFKFSGSVTGDDKLRSITLTSDFNPEIQNFTVWYSPVDYSMKRAEVRFYKSGRHSDDTTGNNEHVWISSIDYRATSMKDVDIDKMINKVFVVKKGLIEPTAAYQQYKIIVTNK